MGKLSEELSKMFKEDFEEIIQREIEEPGFLPQEHFKTCEQRAAAAVTMATERVRKTFALSIAVHREKEHKESNFDEQAALLATGADSEIGTRSFWNE